eukprot:767804-Hanusia_phi.AAC.5
MQVSLDNFATKPDIMSSASTPARPDSGSFDEDPKNSAVIQAIEECRNVLGGLQKDLSEGFKPTVVEGSLEAPHAHKATLGIGLLGCNIDELVIGGPAHSCGKLARGDVIEEIDGVAVNNDNITTQLVGADEPGSVVTLKVRRGNEGSSEVTLTRTASETIADKRQIFELFTQVKTGHQKEDEKAKIMTKIIGKLLTDESIVS